MEFSDIPDVRLAGQGVMFRYLVIRLEDQGRSRPLVRAWNYQPWVRDVEDQMLDSVREELDGFEGRWDVIGGGSFCLNRYDETLTLFGASSRYGAEPDRDAVSRLLSAAFPDHKVANGQAPPQEDSKVRRPAGG